MQRHHLQSLDGKGNKKGESPTGRNSMKPIGDYTTQDRVSTFQKDMLIVGLIISLMAGIFLGVQIEKRMNEAKNAITRTK